MENEKILNKVKKLIQMYKNGELGGEVMPENNQYWLELTEEEKKKSKEKSNTNDVIEFIVNNI